MMSARRSMIQREVDLSAYWHIHEAAGIIGRVICNDVGALILAGVNVALFIELDSLTSAKILCFIKHILIDDKVFWIRGHNTGMIKYCANYEDFASLKCCFGAYKIQVMGATTFHKKDIVQFLAKEAVGIDTETIWI